jgi:hypothetical protein
VHSRWAGAGRAELGRGPLPNPLRLAGVDGSAASSADRHTSIRDFRRLRDGWSGRRLVRRTYTPAA